MERFDARLVRDACGNPDVLMKEAHDGLFVRYADHIEEVRVLREAGMKLFESHCLNVGHSKSQMCPVCVEARVALSGER